MSRPIIALQVQNRVLKHHLFRVEFANILMNENQGITENYRKLKLQGRPTPTVWISPKEKRNEIQSVMNDCNNKALQGDSSQ